MTPADLRRAHRDYLESVGDAFVWMSYEQWLESMVLCLLSSHGTAYAASMRLTFDQNTVQPS